MLSKNSKRLAVLAMTLVSVSSFAQGLDDEAALNADPIGVVTAPQMDVNGTYQVPSEAAKLKKQTEDLARKTNDMVQTKIETKRSENEKKLANELQGMFNGQPVQDQVAVRAAAPTVIAAAPEAPAKAKIENNFKVIPYGGASFMSGEGEVNFQSKVNAGLRGEMLALERRIGIGAGFNFSSMDIQDQRFVGGQFNQFSQNQAPEFQYRNMSGELYGKFYLLTEETFRPYVGAGMAYNSTRLTNSNQINYYNQSGFQNSNSTANGYDASYASGAAMVGTDLFFTDRIGANIEFKYSRALSSGFSSNNTNNNNFQGYNGAYLQQLGQQMDDASIMALNFGLVVAF